MGGVERLRELAYDVDHALGRQRRGVSEQRLQVDPIDVAHRDKQAPVGLARVVDRDHVWVIQARRQPRLPQQPLAETLVQREALGQHLQRDRAPQPGIAREIDLAHPAAPDPGSHLVDPDRRALERMSVTHRPLPSPARQPIPEALRLRPSPRWQAGYRWASPRRPPLRPSTTTPAPRCNRRLPARDRVGPRSIRFPMENVETARAIPLSTIASTPAPPARAPVASADRTGARSATTPRARRPGPRHAPQKRSVHNGSPMHSGRAGRLNDLRHTSAPFRATDRACRDLPERGDRPIADQPTLHRVLAGGLDDRELIPRHLVGHLGGRGSHDPRAPPPPQAPSAHASGPIFCSASVRPIARVAAPRPQRPRPIVSYATKDSLSGIGAWAAMNATTSVVVEENPPLVVWSTIQPQKPSN